MNTTRIGQNNFLDKIIAALSIMSLLFIPDIKVSDSVPILQLIDFLLPIVLIQLLIKRSEIKTFKFHWFLILFCAYIFFTIGINSDQNSVNDLFEIYKFIKFGIFFTWASTLDFNETFKPFIKPTFILLCLINCIHFFELFHFNEWIGNRYGGDKNITGFGLNSLGYPVSKRLTGFSANPNNNAILFSLFFIYFFPVFQKEKNCIWSIIALFFMFLCQSKTSFIFLGSLLIWCIATKNIKMSIKEYTMFIVSLISTFLIAYLCSTRFLTVNSYSSYAFSAELTHIGSTLGRLETWKLLGEMILEKPFFGHGPYKNYFYSNNLYSENEYILYTWRYGIFGLILYFSLYFIPYMTLRKYKSASINLYVCFVILFLCSALTNNPMSERNLFTFFAILVGLLFNPLREKIAYSKANVK